MKNYMTPNLLKNGVMALINWPRHVQPNTPEWAENKTGIPADRYAWQHA